MRKVFLSSKMVRAMLVFILALSLGVSPTFAQESDTAQDTETATDTTVQGNYNTDDPEFYKYYTLDDDGNVVPKEGIYDEEGNEVTTDSASGETLARMGSGFGNYEHPSKYADYTIYDCIDVSEHQGTINWTKVKKAGITHAIIRVAYRGYGSSGSLNADSYYKTNIKGAYKAGIKVGVYIFSQALTNKEAKAEANYIIKKIKSYKSMITLPVVFDYEYTSGRFRSGVISKSKMTSNCKAFCEQVKDAGYTPMVYANYSMLKNSLNYKTLQSKYKIWLAHYTSNKSATSYPGKFYMWQYSSSGTVSGISGRVDVNYIYSNDISKTKDSDGNVIFKDSDGTVLKSQWVSYGGKYYYASKTGAILKDGFHTVGSTKRYFTSSGVAKSKTWVTVSGNKYYLTSKGAVATGYKKIGNYYYGFKDSGVMYKGKTATIAGYKYKFASDGKSILYTAKTTSDVNYRSGASTKYAKKGAYSKGTKVNVVRTYNGWSRLTNGYWIKSSYTKKITKYPKTVTVTTSYKAKTTTAVNYRTGPGTSYTKKGTYAKGKTVTIKKEKAGWGKMSNGYWLKLSYVKKI